MSGTIRIKSPVTPVLNAFKSFSKEKLTFRMSREQIGSLANMIDEMLTVVSDDDSELEIIILKEVKILLVAKYKVTMYTASVSFSCSQSRTLFLWLNDFDFSHPLENSFACWVIDQIYKRVI